MVITAFKNADQIQTYVPASSPVAHAGQLHQGDLASRTSRIPGNSVVVTFGPWVSPSWSASWPPATLPGQSPRKASLLLLFAVAPDGSVRSRCYVPVLPAFRDTPCTASFRRLILIYFISRCRVTSGRSGDHLRIPGDLEWRPPWSTAALAFVAV